MNATFWLIALPPVASPVVYLAGRTVNLLKHRQLSLSRWVALAALLVTWIPFYSSVRSYLAGGELQYSLGLIHLRLDGISLLLSGLALGLGTLVIVYSHRYMQNETGESKYYAMLVAMVGMMIGLSSSYDLFNLWLWFEGMAIASYLLVAFYREEKASLEAGVKYLVQSATGSVFVLMGIALVFGSTGSLDLADIQAAATPRYLFLISGALFLIGFGIKAALVPLHTWLPDAHSQAPSGISAMLSGVVIEAGLIALLRVLIMLSGVTPSWGILLMSFGALNMLAGNLLALRQTHVKRILAFSSISHVGYMLTGFGIGFYAGNLAGVQGGFLHMLTHGMMKGLAFLAVGALMYAYEHGRAEAVEHKHTSLTISDFAGAAQKYPVLALTFSLALLGLGGLPPLAGFMSKWQIFLAGFQTGEAAVMALIVFAGLNSVLSLGYYAPLVNTMYRSEPSKIVSSGVRLPFAILLPLAILAFGVIVVGFWPGLLDWLAALAAENLIGALGS